MLTLVASAGASLDPGSVALGMARRFCEAGERVLFVDADPAGTRLAERFSRATLADYSPAERGMASLIVAREQLTMKLAASHCYSLDDGSLWALFAPLHADGALHSARWLAERADAIEALDRERRVVLSSSLGAADLLAPLARNAAVRVVLAPVESGAQAAALPELCRAAGLAESGGGPGLVVEGTSPLDDDEIRSTTGLEVAGRLPVVADDKVLRLGGGRLERAFARERDRAFVRELDSVAGRLLALSSLDGAPGAADADPGPPAGGEVCAPERSTTAANGSVPEAGSVAGELPESLGRRRA